MSYNSGVIVLVTSNYSPDYSLNCTPLSPITITSNVEEFRAGPHAIKDELAGASKTFQIFMDLEPRSSLNMKQKISNKVFFKRKWILTPYLS